MPRMRCSFLSHGLMVLLEENLLSGSIHNAAERKRQDGRK